MKLNTIQKLQIPNRLKSRLGVQNAETSTVVVALTNQLDVILHCETKFIVYN